MGILGLILACIAGWLVWQVIAFIAAAAVAAVFLVICVVGVLGMILVDPALSHSPAALVFIITVGVVTLVIWSTLRNEAPTRRGSSPPRGMATYEPEVEKK